MKPQKKEEKKAVRKYKVITLCGSTRFKDAFMEAQKRLTLEGNIVISVGLFGHAGDSEVWENMPEDTLTKTKEKFKGHCICRDGLTPVLDAIREADGLTIGLNYALVDIEEAAFFMLE